MSYGEYSDGNQEFGGAQGFGQQYSYPGQPGYGQPGSTPPTYRVWGIIAVIGGVAFNLILGVPAALVGRRYARQVPGLWASGDVQAAVSASRKARGWLIASSVLDALGIILVIAIIAQSSGSNFNNPSTVAASIKTQTQQRINAVARPAGVPAVTVTSVVCTSSGTDTDTCVVRLSTGETFTKTATISGNGTGYSTN